MLLALLAVISYVATLISYYSVTLWSVAGDYYLSANSDDQNTRGIVSIVLGSLMVIAAFTTIVIICICCLKPSCPCYNKCTCCHDTSTACYDTSTVTTVAAVRVVRVNAIAVARSN